MSKMIEHAAYFEEDPNDPQSAFFVVRVGVKKALVEAGFVEKLARFRRWDETGSPCEYLRVGVANDANRDGIAAVKKEAEEAAQVLINAEVEAVVAMIQGA